MTDNYDCAQNQGTIAYGGIIMDNDNLCMDDNHEMCREPLVRMEDGTIIEDDHS
jgi:hypothetical protein